MKKMIRLFIIVNLAIFVNRCCSLAEEISNKKLTKGPHFLMTEYNNVSAVAGSTIFLDCYVADLGNKIVSWLRHKDINLLTSGTYTYTSDQRFSSIFNAYEGRWSLKLRFVRKEDEGFYECQISTTPPIGRKIYLAVYEPVTKIIGEPEIYVDVGTLVNLTCVVVNQMHLYGDIEWKFNNQEINYDSKRGGLSIVIHKDSNETVSELLMQNARKFDSGLYTCHPTYSHPATIRLHVINDKEPEAMISSGAVKLNSLLNKLIHLLIKFAI